MIDLAALHRLAVIDIDVDGANVVHFGHVRVVLPDRLVAIHEDEAEPACCADGRVVLVPLGVVRSIEIYPNAKPYQEAVASLVKMHDGPLKGMEVR